MGRSRGAFPSIIDAGGSKGGNMFWSPLVGVRGQHPWREFFLKKFLVKYCNFVVNLDHLLCHKFDSRSYVNLGIFLPWKATLYYIWGIVLQMYISLREDTVREWRGSYNGCSVGCIYSIFVGRNKERIGNFSVDVSHIRWIMYIYVYVCIAFLCILFPHVFYWLAILFFNNWYHSWRSIWMINS